MRQHVAEGIRRLNPGQSVIVRAEYGVRAGNERAFSDALRDFETSVGDAPGLVYFKPTRSERRGDVVRYDTEEKWSTAVSFLNYWRSDFLRRFHRTVEMLCPLRSPGGDDEPFGRLSFSAGEEMSQPSSPHHGSSQGPPPPPSRGGEAYARPLKTGQRRSWNSDGELRGPGPRSGDDGDLELGETYREWPRFLDNGNGTVTDRLTGLTWLRNANMYGEVPWPAAVQLATQLASGAPGLNDGSKAGDWRLPNVNEMESLLDLDNSFGPALPADAPFINLETTNYWTSSSVALAPALGWFVALAVGPPVFDLKMNGMRMWPVKGRSTKVLQTGQKKCFGFIPSENMDVDCRTAGKGQDGAVQAGAAWPNPRFTDGGDRGIVRDNLTGLVWLKNANAFGRLSWQDALDACDALESGLYGLDDESNRGDWRLPNLNELRSLVDYSQYAPALPRPHYFTDVKSSLYWSSTTVASAPRFARFVFIGVGPSVWDHKSVLMNVWACRNRSGRDSENFR
jgi:hypothetical protein